MTLCFRSAKIINHTFWHFVFKIKFAAPFLPTFWLVVVTSYSHYLLFICSCPSSFSSGSPSLSVPPMWTPMMMVARHRVAYTTQKYTNFHSSIHLLYIQIFVAAIVLVSRHCRFFAHFLCSLSNVICMCTLYSSALMLFWC